ncbi:hypothetical protein B30_07086 [Celeribacter baekdonensis B30]|uniref:Uncharacterized protein n=1 Tax=Celeribacter baekdonensis B30 TaxID=1208323 RepID=K2JDI6_9RHOB|nr:hypothetical protein B30_07086 [Celeribacter baekdonensis B30]KAB6718001.1 hypothetical protein C8029_02385 [Roseobacter sp. TSBP12]
MIPAWAFSILGAIAKSNGGYVAVCCSKSNPVPAKPPSVSRDGAVSAIIQNVSATTIAANRWAR